MRRILKLGWLLPLGVGLGLVVIALVVVARYPPCFCPLWLKHSITAPSSWQAIVPGQTTAEEAVRLLGAADYTEDREGYRVYGYTNRGGLGWKTVELWIQDRERETIVAAVYRTTPYRTSEMDGQPLADIQNLGAVVSLYGRPDLVTWSGWCGSRYLIWAQRGVAVEASENLVEPDENIVFSVLLFEPLEMNRCTKHCLGYLGSHWPWPPEDSGWPGVSCLGADVHRQAEDPYNWEDTLVR